MIPSAGQRNQLCTVQQMLSGAFVTVAQAWGALTSQGGGGDDLGWEWRIVWTAQFAVLRQTTSLGRAVQILWTDSTGAARIHVVDSIREDPRGGDLIFTCTEKLVASS